MFLRKSNIFSDPGEQRCVPLTQTQEIGWEGESKRGQREGQSGGEESEERESRGERGRKR